MELPEWMLHQSFRYCLGRMTYAVKTFVDWTIENWHSIPEYDQNLIKKELNEAFRNDDLNVFLDMEIDLQQWLKLKNYINDPHYS